MPNNTLSYGAMVLVQSTLFVHHSDSPIQTFCEGGGDVVGVLTLLVGGAVQAFHDDRVVELRVQLGVQEVEGKKGKNR